MFLTLFPLFLNIQLNHYFFIFLSNISTELHKPPKQPQNHYQHKTFAHSSAFNWYYITNYFFFQIEIKTASFSTLFYFYRYPVARDLISSSITQNLTVLETAQNSSRTLFFFTLSLALFIFNLTFWIFWLVNDSDRYVTAQSTEIFSLLFPFFNVELQRN